MKKNAKKSRDTATLKGQCHEEILDPVFMIPAHLGPLFI